MTSPVPRELVDGLYWLGTCDMLPAVNGPVELHGYASVFLLAGRDRSIIIEGGAPDNLDVIDAQLDGLVGGGVVPPVEYVFVTHAEPPHSSGMGLWLEKYHEARLIGDVRDLHLIFPTFVDRFVQCKIGDSFDLGDSDFVMVDPVIKDLPATLWGFETSRRALFPGDGFAYSHQHEAGQCGMVAEEVPEMPYAEMTAKISEAALWWMVFTDMEPYIRRLDELIFTELKVELIAPTHGLPMTDPALSCPLIYDGLRLSSRINRPSLQLGQ